MAIDTIGLQSPYLSDELAERLEQECVRRQGVEIKTGELLYSITTGALEGSYDSRISICVKREQWVSNGKHAPVRVPCKPFLYVEGSVHKAMLGHNVYGGPDDFLASCRWMISLVEKLIETELPPADQWLVKRVDQAEVYELPSFEACQEYFRGLNAADYPRRSVNRYGLSGIYAAGSSTVLKFYHKGPEFQKHDRNRLKKLIPSEELFALIEKAHRIIRVEVEVKARKLEYDFGRLPLVGEVSEEYLKRVHDVEVQRFLREGAKEMTIVRDALAVRRRLFEMHSASLAGNLLGFWYQLTTIGEDVVKKSMKKATFYKYRKLLVDSGVSWHGTDVVLREYSLIPEGFAPVRSDPRRVLVELPAVREKLAPFRMDAERKRAAV